MTDQRKRERPDDYFSDWKEREALAEAMIPQVGAMARERNVKCYIYGHSLVNQSVLDIMKTHRYVRQVEHNELSEFETAPVLNAMRDMPLGPSHIDVGRLAVEFYDKGQGEGLSLEEYVSRQLGFLVNSTQRPVEKPVDVVLYGFGRIGRLMARILINKTDGGDSLRLRAVVVRKGGADNDLVKVDSGDKLSVGDVEIEFLHTPGHTPGSQCFRIKNTLVSGDTLFIQGCGRVDLPGSDPDQMYESLKKLCDLPDETILFPGHNYSDVPRATMAETKRVNFHLKVPSIDMWRQMMGAS